VDAEKIDGSLYHAYGEWVLNDSHLLIQFDWFNSIPLDFIPLFDIKARTLHNLNTLAGIPAEYDYLPNCQMAFAAPDGQSGWATCYSGDYLIDLATFTSVEYPMSNSYDYPTWSANSQFAWMQTDPRLLLSVSNKTLSPLPVDPLYDSELWWHPTDNILAYLSEDGRKLELLNAQTLSPQEVELPTVFQSLAWSPRGDSIALLAKEGSLWQLDYPRFRNLEQLMMSSAEGKDIKWSPDGTSIAFISGSDIYIVETTK
jgi:WD40 repeat protein